MHIPGSTNVLQAYVHKMAQCLLDISDDHESKSHLDLQRYSLEMAACFVCCWMTTAHKAAAAVTESLSLRDDVCPLQHEGLPNKLYKDLLVNTTCCVWPVATVLLCFGMLHSWPVWGFSDILHGSAYLFAYRTDRHTGGRAGRQADRQIAAHTDTQQTDTKPGHR